MNEEGDKKVDGMLMNQDAYFGSEGEIAIVAVWNDGTNGWKHDLSNPG